MGGVSEQVSEMEQASRLQGRVTTAAAPKVGITRGEGKAGACNSEVSERGKVDKVTAAVPQVGWKKKENEGRDRPTSLCYHVQ